MTQAELVDHVAAAVPLSMHQTETVGTQGLQAMRAARPAGERVALRGCGRVPLRHRVQATTRAQGRRSRGPPHISRHALQGPSAPRWCTTAPPLQATPPMVCAARRRRRARERSSPYP